MANDVIAVVDSPEEEAVIYANARVSAWGKTLIADNAERAEGISPIPVTPSGREEEAPLSPDDDIEAIRARALEEAEAGD